MRGAQTKEKKSQNERKRKEEKMSSSIFKDYDEPLHDSSFDDDNLKVEKNLIILVREKTGKVTVDERSLHSLLGELSCFFFGVDFQGFFFFGKQKGALPVLKVLIHFRAHF